MGMIFNKDGGDGGGRGGGGRSLWACACLVKIRNGLSWPRL